MSGQILGLVGFAIVVAAGIRWYTLIQQVAIPRDRTLLYGCFGVGAFFGLLALFNQPGWAVGLLALLAVLVGTLLPALRLRSDQAKNEPACPVGAAVPFFTAVDDHGRHFDSNQLAGKPYLLKFFRGHW
jgi:hypothetical protein